MIVVTKEPDVNYPNPVENCVPFWLTSGDYQNSAGSKGSTRVIFLNGNPNVNGQSLTFLGLTFSIDDTTPHTGLTYDGTSAVGLTNATNFMNMLMANPNLVEYGISIVDLGGGSFGVDVMDCEFRANADLQYTSIDLDFPSLTTINLGSDYSYKDEYKILYRLFRMEGGVLKPLCPVQEATPSVDLGTQTVLPVVLDFQHDLSPLLKTSVPDIDSNVPFLSVDSCADIYIKYWSKEGAGDCNLIFSDVETAGPYKIINAACQPDDPDGFLNHVETGLNKIDPMTTEPENMRLCRDQNQWLYYYLDRAAFIDQFFSVPITYFLRVIQYENGVQVSSNDIDFGTDDGVWGIPVGPNNSIDPILSNTTEYTVQVMFRYDAGGSLTELTTSALRRYKVANNCCNQVQLIFLSSKGGYSSMGCTELVSRLYETLATEICQEVDCGGTYKGNLFQGGKRQVNASGFEKTILRTRLDPAKKEFIEFYKDMKSSENVMIVVEDLSGTKVMRRFLIEPGQVVIYQKGEVIFADITGYYSRERNQISGQ